MEHWLRAALEAGSSEELLRLCAQLDNNVKLASSASTTGTREPTTVMTVTHHVALRPVSPQCLKLLIDRLGPDCLTCRNESGETPVHIAAMQKDDSWMKLIHDTLGKERVPILTRGGSNKQTVVHYAAMSVKNSSTLKFLVTEFGSGILTVPDRLGNTVVHLAAKHRGVDVLELIQRELGNSCFDLKTYSNETVFHLAAVSSDNSKLKWLVKELGSGGLTVPDGLGNTAVHLAVKNQGVDSLELIKRELGKSSFDLKTYYKRTVFHLAAESNDNSKLKWLVKEFGSSGLTVPDGFGSTAVHLAVRYQGMDSLELIKAELGTGSFLVRELENMTVVHIAAQQSDNSKLKWLMNQCESDCLAVPDDWGNTVSHYAAQYQSVDSLQAIKQRLGAEIFQQKGRNRRTVFHIAAMRRQNSVLKWLVMECGSEGLTVPDEDGNTAVHFAIEHQGIDSLELFKVVLGTDCFQLKGLLDTTAIHIAAKRADSQKLKWLVNECGSSCLTVPDRDGNTAVHFAAIYQSVDSLTFLDDQLGSEVLSLTNNAGEELVDCVEKDTNYHRKSSKRNWITRRKSLPEIHEPIPKQLDHSFTKWEFILLEEKGGRSKKQLVGKGRFSKVFKALTDRYQTVAVKIVKLAGANDSSSHNVAIEREKRGMEILKRMSHPNIMLFVKCEYESDKRFCIFTELVAGQSLSDMMKRQKNPISESGIKDFSKQICLGLNYLHSQGPVLHRDIKCSNIMLTHEGVIKLIDFGLAKEIVVASTSGLSSQVCGTYYFMAPELFQVDFKLQYSVKTDVWAFGCALFEMTTMKPPNGDLSWINIPIMWTRSDAEMPQISADFSTSLRQFYCRCVARDPKERADTAELLRHSFLSASS